MKKKRTLFFISSLMLLGSGTTIAGDNLHFTGNLISKSCTPVINGSQLAEVHFPAIAASDLMNIGQSERVPLVIQLKDCQSSTSLSVRVTLTGTEDSELATLLPAAPEHILVYDTYKTRKTISLLNITTHERNELRTCMFTPYKYDLL